MLHQIQLGLLPNTKRIFMNPMSHDFISFDSKEARIVARHLLDLADKVENNELPDHIILEIQ